MCIRCVKNKISQISLSALLVLCCVASRLPSSGSCYHPPPRYGFPAWPLVDCAAALCCPHRGAGDIISWQRSYTRWGDCGILSPAPMLDKMLLELIYSMSLHRSRWISIVPFNELVDIMLHVSTRYEVDRWHGDICAVWILIVRIYPVPRQDVPPRPYLLSTPSPYLNIYSALLSRFPAGNTMLTLPRPSCAPPTQPPTRHNAGNMFYYFEQQMSA